MNSQANLAVAPIDRSQHEILVVDDEPASRYATARLLRSVGFRTREAASGAAALEAADEGISAVVLDVHLPDIDGMEVCRLLRARSATQHLPVLHLSAAYVTDEDKVRGLDAGADAYLTHPVEPAVIVATVQALVRARVAETAMRESEAKFRSLYENAPSGICQINSQGDFAEINLAMAQLVGLSPAELIGRSLLSMVPQEYAELAYQRFCVSEHGAWQGAFPMQSNSGAWVDIEWRVSGPARNGLRMAVATDISARVQLERTRQQLIEQEQAARSEAERIVRMKDELVAVLSHELRTPLTAVMGWVSILQRRPDEDKLQRGLDVIKRNCQLQARLLSDILDVSRMNAGKLQLDIKCLDPQEFLRDTVATLRPTLEEGGHAVALQFDGPYRPLAADPARLEQIVWNLLNNAAKFSPRGGTILVGLEQTETGVRFSITDQGRGIEPAFLPHLFDRFSQEDARANRHHGGLGLGLSIVKQLAELHGGSVHAHSEGLGKGAVFHVDLPDRVDLGVDAVPSVEASGSTEAMEENQSGDELQGVRVLLVDDDLDACQALAMMLSDRGAEVQVAHRCDDALKLLRSGLAPSILISDLGMPGRTGFDLIRDIRAAELPPQRLPAIALTAFTRPQDVSASIEAGFDAHCAKPLWPPEMIRLIDRLSGDRSPSAPAA